MMFVSLIKESIKSFNKDYLDRLYTFEGKQCKRSKPFCFATYYKDFTAEDQMLNIHDKVMLYISTPDYECGINLYNGLLNMRSFQYKGFTLQRLKIGTIKEKNIKQEQAVFKTLSPIFIKDKENKPLTPDDENYEEELNYIVNKCLENCRGYGLKHPIKFQQILMKKTVVKEDIRKFTEETNKEVYYVNAYSGIFKLEGDVEDLNLIYQNGIGFRRNQGFGMVEVV